MKKLIHGIVDFRKSLTDENRELFAKLALGQKPDALFVACSDSRVAPNVFVSTNPGDLFVLRNMGNFVPAFTESFQDTSASAAIEFALSSLNVLDIIVCGHSECGAIQAIIEGVDSKSFPHLENWLRHGQEAYHKVKNGFTINTTLSLKNQISQVNVLQQMEHIRSYPLVKEKLKKGKLRIHGWWFDIAQADVYCYEESFNQFVLIDENEAQLILERLNS